MQMSELRCFLVVAEELHISRAARRVYLSQPAMSRLIDRIERAVGTRLLDRSGLGLSLTPAGTVFADDAARIVRDFDRAVVRAQAAAIGARPGRRGRRLLRIGIFFPAAAELTAPILAAYRSSSPGVHLEIVDVAVHGGEEALTAGRVDVAFLWSPVVAQGVTSVALFEDKFALLVASNHRLSGGGKLSVEDVSDAPYTVTTSMSRAWQDASTLKPWRSRPNHAVPVKTVTDAMKTIKTGAAVSIGPTCLARYAPVTGISFVPIDMSARPLALLCRRSADDRPETREFVALATQTARRLAPLVPIPQ